MAELLILALLQEYDEQQVPRNRITFPGCNAFNLSDEVFIQNFRLSKPLAFQLIEELKPFVEPVSCRKTNLTTEIKVLCALNFFAYGCHQTQMERDFQIKLSQRSVSKCIREVSTAMSKNLLRKYVKFPDDQSAQKLIKDEFLECCGLGGVLGAIDCTHVSILAPVDDGFHNKRNYVNRKGWHSINVQLVSDMNMRILNVVARFPGCSEDAYIWLSCNLKLWFESGNKIHGEGWLLGDSGYPQTAHLHTPFKSVCPGSQEEQYNTAHAQGRRVIEQCNGVLKNRFRCLLKHHTLYYKPEMACRIVNACVILHNMCIEAEMMWEEVDLLEEDELFDTVDEIFLSEDKPFDTEDELFDTEDELSDIVDE